MRHLINQLPPELKDLLLERLAASSHSKDRPPPMSPEMALLGALNTIVTVEVVRVPKGEDPEAFAARVEAETAAALEKAKSF